ncbi:MAG: hypothetical protein DRJ42_29830 [Deltaproteobacteria bacterium]|nr:MAG: hypothetical protein DRJ42_29830 [Deltaproteobacteria bacterium]
MKLGGLRHLAVLASCVVIVACGRIGYDGVGDSATDGSMDTGVADADTGARDSAPSDTGPVDSGPLDGGPSDSGVPDTGPADAGMCSESPCRLVLPQCGCSSGQMCARVTAGSPVRSCVREGATPLGEYCIFATGCQAGFTCVRGNGAGICMRWCEGPGDCAGTECLRLVIDDSVGACRIPCNPIDRTGCAVGTACYVAPGAELSGASATLTLCVAPGTGAIGTACTAPFDCQPGLACPIDRCVELCDLDAPSCGTGTCMDLGWSADGVRYGECG